MTNGCHVLFVCFPGVSPRRKEGRDLGSFWEGFHSLQNRNRCWSRDGDVASCPQRCHQSCPPTAEMRGTPRLHPKPFPARIQLGKSPWRVGCDSPVTSGGHKSVPAPPNQADLGVLGALSPQGDTKGAQLSPPVSIRIPNSLKSKEVLSTPPRKTPRGVPENGERSQSLPTPLSRMSPSPSRSNSDPIPPRDQRGRGAHAGPPRRGEKKKTRKKKE